MEVKEDGVVNPASFERGTFRLNVDYQATEKFRLTSSINYSRKYNRLPGGVGAFLYGILSPPLSVPYDEDGKLIVEPYGDSLQKNPLLWIRDNQEEEWNNRIFGNLVLTYDILKNLSYSVNLALDAENGKYGLFATSVASFGSLNRALIRYNEGSNYTIENILNYSKNFNDFHNLDVTLLYSYQQDQGDNLSANNRGLENESLGYNGITLGTQFGGVGRDYAKWQLQSNMARLRYGFKGKYLVTLTGRMDGSSKFGKDNKYGFFPSAAVAWNLNQEPFLSSSSTIDQLKLRLSYGQIGNQEIPIYQSLPRTTNIGYPFGTALIIGSVPSSLSNPDLKWETTTQFNLGLDFGFFGNRLNGSFEYFSSNTNDLLLQREIPPTLGFGSVVTNIGETKANGVELNLNGVLLDVAGFQWKSNLNLSRSKSKIVSLSGKIDNEGNPVDDIGNKWFIGEPIGSQYDYEFAGVWQTGDDIANSAQPTAKPGDIKVVDQNNDGVISSVDDRVILGNTEPDWYGGWTNNFKYKGFELSLFITTVQGVLRSNSFLQRPYGNNDARWNGLYRNYWTPENPSNEWPRPNANVATPLYSSALEYEDASYTALRNLT